MMSVVFSYCAMKREKARSEAINGEGCMRGNRVGTESAAMKAYSIQQLQMDPITNQHPVGWVMYILLEQRARA